MNFNTDQPIETKEQDILGRNLFSSKLAESIFEFQDEESLVIGIYGKWGVGKTSIVNLTLKKLEELARNSQDKEQIIIRFSPWSYSDSDDLKRLFFYSLREAINTKYSNIGKYLNDYMDCIDAIPSNIPYLKFLWPAIKDKITYKDLNFAKSELLKVLKQEIKHKIVVFIDDIDRLTNSQIRDIFLIVKQLGDLPNIRYILAMDRDVVVQALKDIHNIDGNEYLEKIIQVPIEIPGISTSKLHDIIFNKLDHLLKPLPKVQFDPCYWMRVFEKCISPYLQNLRDVNRLINILAFRFQIMYKETCFVDMAWISTIELFEPKLYKWISENKDSLCGGVFRIKLSSIDEYKSKYTDEFMLLGLDPEETIERISLIFPIFAKDVGNIFYQTDIDTIRNQKRIGELSRFDFYFSYNVDEIIIPSEYIENCINCSTQDIKNYIKYINSEEKIIYFIEEIQARINNIPNDILRTLARVIINTKHEFQGEKNLFIKLSAVDIADSCLNNIYSKLSDNEVFKLFNDALLSCNLDSIGYIAHQLHYSLSHYSLSPRISTDEQEKLEQVFLHKINDFKNDKNFINPEDFLSTFKLWEKLNEKEAREYLNNNILNDSVKQLKFVCKFARSTSDTLGKITWYYHEDEYKKYGILTDCIKSSIKEINTSTLTEKEKHKLSPFLI